MSKGLIRSLVKRGSKDVRSRGRAREESRGVVRDGSVCDRCGAIYARRSWRRSQRRLPARPFWTVCAACRESSQKEWHGRVLARGVTSRTEQDTISRRIHNVASRATFTQPERRLVSMEWSGDDLEVLTTSQRLAHRIVRELTKLLGGVARLHWDAHDGSLSATWQRAAKAAG